jgi:16S rRNA pseudouridine516 synthase
MGTMRLDRCLANAGLGSRTQVRDFLRQGRVTVDGQIVREPGFLIPDGASPDLRLDGQPLTIRHEIHIMLYKPAGVVTALEDRKLPTIASLLPEQLWRRGLFPVGRLDRETTGLLLLTTDGTLGHRLASPACGVWKTYEIEYSGPPLGPCEVDQFARGLVLSDGTVCRPAKLVILAGQEAELIIHEGKFHQVRRMMQAVGRPVIRLHRRAIDSLILDPALLPGQWRELTDDEILMLYAAAGLPCRR